MTDVEWDDDPGLRDDDWPFAMRLHKELLRREVVIAPEFEQLPGNGQRIQLGADWKQYHVRAYEQMGALINRLIMMHGNELQFSELWVPPSGHTGVKYASWACSDGVWVRHLVAYRPSQDDFISRYDVLVRTVRENHGAISTMVIESK